MSHHTRYSRPFICHILSFSYIIIIHYLQQPQPMMNSCCYLLRRHFFKKISINSHSNDKQHERHDWDTLSSAEKKLAAILEACRHTSESKSTIVANNCISMRRQKWAKIKMNAHGGLPLVSVPISA